MNGRPGAVGGGLLTLSALAAAAYAAATSDETRTIPSGLAFGLVFYVAAHRITGPALGAKQPEWRADEATLGMHAANHILFGLITAAAAEAASTTTVPEPRRRDGASADIARAQHLVQLGGQRGVAERLRDQVDA